LPLRGDRGRRRRREAVRHDQSHDQAAEPQDPDGQPSVCESDRSVLWQRLGRLDPDKPSGIHVVAGLLGCRNDPEDPEAWEGWGIVG
ncbi:hypothetical protein LTR53_019212, partial [Teratosphaeriaceae sp. CCFEE 6253]